MSRGSVNPSRPSTDKDSTRSSEFIEHTEARDEADHADDDLASPQDRLLADAHEQQDYGTLIEDVKSFASSYDLTSYLPVLINGALLYADASHPEIRLSDNEARALEGETDSRWTQPGQLYFTIAICSIGAIMQGWCQTGSNGATLGFPQAFNIDGESGRDRIIVGAINAGPFVCIAVLGAWVSTPINLRLGRRGAIFSGAALCLIAVLAAGMSQSWPQLLLARLILGLGMGLNASTVSVYAAECAPAAIRGGLAVSWQMFTAFGIFLGFCANLAMINQGSIAWRLQLGSAFIPTIPLLACIYMCPESPAWLIDTKVDYKAAFESLRRLRNTEVQAARDVYYMYTQQHLAKKIEESQPSFFSQFIELFTIPRNARAALAAGTGMFVQQACGINIIAFYSSTIFSTAGFSTYIALTASCAFGFINTLFALPAIYAMDKFGRRSLLLYTFPPMAACMAATSLCFRISVDSSWYLPSLSVFLVLFTMLYSPGAGPVPFTYASEIFPLSHRSIGMSFSVSTSSVFASLLSLTFPWLLGKVGTTGAFAFYAGGNLLSWVLTWAFCPEVKGLRLEDVGAVFERAISDRWAEDMQEIRMRIMGKSGAAEYQLVQDGSDAC